MSEWRLRDVYTDLEEARKRIAELEDKLVNYGDNLHACQVALEEKAKRIEELETNIKIQKAHLIKAGERIAELEAEAKEQETAFNMLSDISEKRYQRIADLEGFATLVAAWSLVRGDEALERRAIKVLEKGKNDQRTERED